MEYTITTVVYKKENGKKKVVSFYTELAPILLDMALFYQFYRFPQDIALPVLPQRKKSFRPCLSEAIRRTELHDMFKMHEIFCITYAGENYFDNTLAFIL